MCTFRCQLSKPLSRLLTGGSAKGESLRHIGVAGSARVHVSQYPAAAAVQGTTLSAECLHESGSAVWTCTLPIRLHYVHFGNLQSPSREHSDALRRRQSDESSKK